MYIYAFYDINKNPPANIIQINRIVPYAHQFDGVSLYRRKILRLTSNDVFVSIMIRCAV